jgi:putative transferase (TIGR04331 family)
VTTVPKYCKYGSAFPVGYGQWLRGFNELLQMAKLLDHKRIPRVTFRPSMIDFGLNQTQRIRRSLPNVEIDDGSRKIYKVLGDHKLIIATSNTTSFLETYALNIPTILFWDSSFWETNQSGDELFSRMRDLNLFFSSPQDLAKFLNDNYSSIDSWWNSKDIQGIREEVCLKYANTSTNFSVDFAKLLNKQIGQT